MKIETGKRYVNFRGEIVGPMYVKYPEDDAKWGCDTDGFKGVRYYDNGKRTLYDVPLIRVFSDDSSDEDENILTQIKIPFGLLDEEIQTNLREWEYGWELYNYRGEWVPMEIFVVTKRDVVRARERKPREYWICSNGYGSKFVLSKRPDGCYNEVIHVREVLDETFE